MIEQILAIIRNTFFESVRQPIMLVLLVIATLAIILSNPLSAFTMENDQRMLIDIGLATIFLCGALLAAFIATNVLGREIHNKTALTVISKPVGRPLFVLGKFLGVAAAMLLATAYMSFVFLLVEQHTVLQTVRDPIHVPVIVFGVGAGVLGLAVGIWCNYFYGKVFSSTVIVVTTPLAGLAYLLSLNFRFDFAVQPIWTHFSLSMWMALAALATAILVLTRLGQVLTLVVTLGVFTIGMVSDHFIGRPIRDLEEVWLQRAKLQNRTETIDHNYAIVLESGETEPVSVKREVATVPLQSFATTGEKYKYAELRTAYAIVPNFQVLWLSDALTQSHKIPPAYIGRTITYGCLQIVAALSLAIILFQRREVG
jgi:ABC-type transport system involved in multi-copper enzyme maturation permease subunit